MPVNTTMGHMPYTGENHVFNRAHDVPGKPDAVSQRLSSPMLEGVLARLTCRLTARKCLAWVPVHRYGLSIFLFRPKRFWSRATCSQ